MTEREIHLSITPEPSDEESAAVAAALAVLASARRPAAASEPKRTVSRWALAGRRAALTSSPCAGNRRWSDPDAWLRR